MSRVDQTSLMLGRMETAMNTHTAILQKMDDKLTLINGSVNKAHNRIDDVEDQMVTKTGAMKAIIGGGLISGAGATGIFSAIKSYLGIS